MHKKVGEQILVKMCKQVIYEFSNFTLAQRFRGMFKNGEKQLEKKPISQKWNWFCERFPYDLVSNILQKEGTEY